MAAVTRLLKLSRFSCSAATVSLRRWLSTTAVYETEPHVKSPLYPGGSPPLRADPEGRNVQWVFLGCPGVGKGTYASRLSSLLSVPHIATGDLVREALSSDGPLSRQTETPAVDDKLPATPQRHGWVSHPLTDTVGVEPRVEFMYKGEHCGSHERRGIASQSLGRSKLPMPPQNRRGCLHSISSPLFV
ncbi:adenosine kinase [Actinidia rufa]|uniref:adenylate kinase n=1 Tax=Actinidia rufa TaxID=165716 RepID=A0A7J0E8Q5_9ERIC|nr:adenosine kinase [Actinidia rufa]